MRTKFSILVIVSLLAIAFSGCKDKNAFFIKGKMENAGKTKTAYLYKTDSTQVGGMTMIDSVSLTDGEFSFKRQSAYPQLYEVLLGGFPINLIAKNGDDINIKLDGKDTTADYIVTGSDDSEKMKEWQKTSNHYSYITGSINHAYTEKIKEAKNKADSNAILAMYLPKFNKNIDDASKATLKFVNENKNSLTAFYAAITLDRIKYEQQLVAYADSIKVTFKGNPAIEAFVKDMASIKPVSIGHAAPDFVLIDSDNKPVKLSDYKGKYVMLDFWASWCAPCRQENPNVVKAYAKYKDKGLNILGISLDEDRKPWLAAVATDHLTWRHAAEFKRFDGPTVKLYKVEAIPSNFIIDPQGVIIAKNIAGTELEDFLNKTFNKSH